jgi:predicted nucleotide-binding protein
LALPIRTTLADIDVVCAYLFTKPTGASLSEARSVIDEKALDGRKLSALKFWGLIEENGAKLRLTDRGRLVAKDRGARQADALKEAIAAIPAYSSIVERAVLRNELAVSANDVATHWYQHFRADSASESDRILNDQAVCFFQLAEGAELGALVVGRKGQSTRLEFNEVDARAFVEAKSGKEESTGAEVKESTGSEDERASASAVLHIPEKATERGNRVFITHGKNKKILEQVKELVSFGKFEPVVAQERETAAKSVPDKVMDDMRGCHAAVIHVGREGVLFDENGKEVPQINGNVLIEIGAALALYRRNFILLVEEGVQLPSNLQGLYECRYAGDELNMPATMKLLKAFNEFK